jgi:predicted enzyme related to lactoylglutathione lyase
MKSLSALTMALVLCAGLGSPCLAEEPAPEAAKNPVIFWELACHDSEKSVAFFEKVFEWKTEMIPNTIIHLARTKMEDGGINGGIFTLQKAKLPFLTIFIQVEDIEAKAKLVEESGGHIVEAPSEAPGGNRICLFNDPSGVTFAMWEQVPPAE